nr:MAG TPA: hypothetical protein [Caudoviricetes sp.]
MIIVSQDKCTIVNLDNIKTIELDRETDFKSIIIFRETNEVETGVCGLLIGHYTTRERAKEVLQEIITRHGNWENMKVGQPSGICLPVYEMPKD